jgi:hypothetical protein
MNFQLRARAPVEGGALWIILAENRERWEQVDAWAMILGFPLEEHYSGHADRFSE